MRKRPCMHRLGNEAPDQHREDQAGHARHVERLAPAIMLGDPDQHDGRQRRAQDRSEDVLHDPRIQPPPPFRRSRGHDRQADRKERPFRRPHHHPRREQGAEAPRKAGKDRAEREDHQRGEQERLAPADRIRPSADEIGAERPGDRKRGTQRPDLGVAEREVPDHIRRQERHRHAVEIGEAEGQPQEKQHQQLVSARDGRRRRLAGGIPADRLRRHRAAPHFPNRLPAIPFLPSSAARALCSEPWPAATRELGPASARAPTEAVENRTLSNSSLPQRECCLIVTCGSHSILTADSRLP